MRSLELLGGLEGYWLESPPLSWPEFHLRAGHSKIISFIARKEEPLATRFGGTKNSGKDQIDSSLNIAYASDPKNLHH